MSMIVMQYIVRFRSEVGNNPEEKVFNSAGPAYGFAYNIEVNGGVALVVAVKKPDPLDSVQTIKEWRV